MRRITTLFITGLLALWWIPNSSVSATTGTTWTSQTSPTSNSWSAVTFGENTFVAVSWDGPVMYSTNGVDWQLATVPTNNSTWYAVTHGNDTFVAVGSSGVNMVSQDGITWSINAPAAPNTTWNAVTFGNGRFVAVGTNGANMWSADGVTWNINTAINASSDANQPLLQELSAVTYNNGMFVATTGRHTSGQTYAVLTSSDGVAWLGHEGDTDENAKYYYWSSLTYGESTFVAVAYNSSNPSVYPVTKYLMTGANGTNWTIGTPQSADWRSVTYGDGTFVAVAANGPNYIMTSQDGAVWALQPAPANTSGWWSVTYGNGMFVAVSYNGYVMTSGTFTLPQDPAPEPEPNQTPTPVVTTTVAPTTTTTTATVSKVNKADTLPETGSSNSLFMFAAIALTLGGAVTIARKRLLN